MLTNKQLNERIKAEIAAESEGPHLTDGLGKTTKTVQLETTELKIGGMTITVSATRTSPK